MSTTENNVTMEDLIKDQKKYTEATPKNNFDFKEGKTVQVFHDWMHELSADEKVTLVQKMWSEKDRDIYGMTTEKWIVRYPDGHELFRFFKTNND